MDQNDVVTLAVTFILEITILTLLPPGAFMFNKISCFDCYLPVATGTMWMKIIMRWYNSCGDPCSKNECKAYQTTKNPIAVKKKKNYNIKDKIGIIWYFNASHELLWPLNYFWLSVTAGGLNYYYVYQRSRVDLDVLVAFRNSVFVSPAKQSST